MVILDTIANILIKFHSAITWGHRTALNFDRTAPKFDRKIGLLQTYAVLGEKCKNL